jgi:hypothetical protein
MVVHAVMATDIMDKKLSLQRSFVGTHHQQAFVAGILHHKI